MQRRIPVELNGTGTALLYSSYLGGSNVDSLSSMALDSAGQVYLAGSSRSSDLRTTPGALQPNRVSSTCTMLIPSMGPRPNPLSFPCEDAVAARFDLSSPSAPSPRVTNAGSYAMQPIAPGTLIALFGQALGPSAGIGTVPDSQGVIGTNLGGVQVLFNGAPAPVLYAQSNQVNVVAPYGIAGQSNATVQVSYRGTQIDFGTWLVADTAPAIFSLDGSGQGEGAILNQDGTINGPGHPAAAGSVISIFATGAGVTSPPGTDGKLAGAPLSQPAASVAVWFESSNPLFHFLTSGQVTYAGAAPALVDGVLQVNVVVPADAASGSAVPVFLQVGSDRASQTGITLAIN